MPYLGIFGLELQNTNVIYEISALEFVYLQTLVQKQKFINLGPKMPYLGIFGLEFHLGIFVLEF